MRFSTEVKRGTTFSILSAILICTATTATAIFDPSYICTTNNREAKIVVDNNPIKLLQRSTVRLTFSPIGQDYFPVAIVLDNGLSIVAHDGHVLGEVEDLPSDKVFRRPARSSGCTHRMVALKNWTK